MKNIFNYATKELSQDAFLRWLFENFNCEDNDSLKLASQFVLKTFCKITDEEIVDVITYSQWHKIDIFTVVKTNKRNIALFIEDKVFSSEHNQLTKYNKTINNSYQNKGLELNRLGCTESDIKRVYYKPLLIPDSELATIKEAGWEAYNIFNISYCFNRFSDTDCILLRQYIEHIKEIEKAVMTNEKPSSSEKGLDLIKWEAYFEFELLPRLNLDTEKYNCSVFITSYNYTCLCIGKKIKSGEKLPYIELRSRDFKEDGFSVTLLCYGVDYKKCGDKIRKVDERIKTAPNKLFIPKFRRGNTPKQLGRTAKTDEDIVSFLKKCIEDYDFATCEW